MIKQATMAITMGATLVVNAQMKYVSHRGESQDAPENTLAAFNLAIARNVSGFECDVFLTKDNHIVCIHDDNTSRVTGGTVNLSVTNATLEELRALDVGSWKSPAFANEKIPTLEETLALARDRFTIYVEIKQYASSGIVPYIKAAIEAEPKATPDRIVFISFRDSSITAIREALPEYDAYWLGSYTTYLNNPNQLVDRLEAMNATGFNGYYNSTAISNGIAQVLHDAGFSAHVWTVNQANWAMVCNDFAIDSITSDSARSMLDNVLGESVAHAWLDLYPELLAENNHDYRAAALAKSGKYDCRGREMSVWEDYIAGTCPTNPSSRFHAFLEIADNNPVLRWTPDLGETRRYTVWGKSHLDDLAWSPHTNSATRFFNVTVEMP